MAGSVALQPSEIRSRGAVRGRKFKPWLVAAAGALILSGSASLFVAAVLLPGSGEIKLGTIEDWPEIKNGVREVMPPKASPDARLASAGSGTRPAEQADSRAPAHDLLNKGSPGREPPGTPAPERQAMAAPAAEASSKLVMSQLRELGPPPPVEVDLAEFRPGAAPGSTDVLQEASPASSAATDLATAALQAPAPNIPDEPLPPRRPKDLTAEPRPKPARVARTGAAPDAERKAGEAQAPAAAPPAAEAPPSAPADERVASSEWPCRPSCRTAERSRTA
jgi:hypothetical protein